MIEQILVSCCTFTIIFGTALFLDVGLAKIHTESDIRMCYFRLVELRMFKLVSFLNNRNKHVVDIKFSIK